MMRRVYLVVGGANLAVCSSASDTYMGVKTPGQRQLIALQERVKLGVISVDQAVQEFKAWQFDHERRSHSLRYQQVDTGTTLVRSCAVLRVQHSGISVCCWVLMC